MGKKGEIDRCSENSFGFMLRIERKKKKVSREKLAEGLCTPGTVDRLERDETDVSLFLLKTLFQRLGLSLNEVELIISCDEFYTLTESNSLENAITTGKYDEAYRILENWDLSTKFQKMMYEREMGFLLLKQGKHQEAMEALHRAVEISLPGILENGTQDYLISVIEMENLLEYQRQKRILSKDDKERKLILRNLQEYNKYISRHFLDDMDKSVVKSKSAAVTAETMLSLKMYEEAVILLKQAIVSNGKNGRFTFEETLLQLISEAYAKMGLPNENNRWLDSYKAIQMFRREYFPGEAGQDEIMKKSSNFDILLDFELIHKTRVHRKISQPDLAEDIFESYKPLWSLEKGLRKTSRKNISALFDKLDMKKNRLTPYLFPLTYDVLKTKTDLDYYLQRNEFVKAGDALEKVKKYVTVNDENTEKTLKMYDLLIRFGQRDYSVEDSIDQIEDYLKDFFEDGKLNVYRPLFSCESVLFNLYSILLEEKGHKEKAQEVRKKITEAFDNSLVPREFRYRAYAVHLLNLLKDNITDEGLHEYINYELTTGRAVGSVRLLLSHFKEGKVTAEENQNIECPEMLKHLANLYFVKCAKLDSFLEKEEISVFVPSLG